RDWSGRPALATPDRSESPPAIAPKTSAADTSASTSVNPSRRTSVEPHEELPVAKPLRRIAGAKAASRVREIRIDLDRDAKGRAAAGRHVAAADRARSLDANAVAEIARRLDSIHRLESRSSVGRAGVAEIRRPRARRRVEVAVAVEIGLARLAHAVAFGAERVRRRIE